MRNQDLEVIVIYQPVNQNQQIAWSRRFFERTFGAWQGETLVRESQGKLPERDSLLGVIFWIINLNFDSH
ncbi:MAG: hypothetical protein KME38_30305 [Spirirestis rafaelensis WJT71-NPBG6]|jgi:ribosomal protein S18 acetylase RimI-like enzyme|nr:hypothetical protein [Spirirestis rafaelensis WJT71-NPBG6]